AGVVEADEELRIGRIRILGAGHRYRAAHVRLSVEFRLEVRIFRSARPGPVWAARLGHEAVDHPVKDDAVVEALGDQLLDVVDMARREGGVHFDDDRTFGRLEGQRVACAHLESNSYFDDPAMRMVMILSGFVTWPLSAAVPALILS